ncbi:hypothetical protein [Mycetocola sp. 2940]|uniref:hypothetical protein n=1 Tax=Mycetocola sp. 2940 TaxID=3156452 RepID=UPI0033936272
MANEFDWIVVPDKESVKTIKPGTAYTYDLVNMTISEALCYQKRDFGINLGFTDPGESSNIRFLRKSGTGDIKYGEMFAIGVRAGRWLYYQKRDFGPNLGWSELPKFEWRFDAEDGRTGTVSVIELVGLYNSVEKDTLMYERRDWGVNLKWFKDAGKHDSFGDLKEVANRIKSIKEGFSDWFG